MNAYYNKTREPNRDSTRPTRDAWRASPGKPWLCKQKSRKLRRKTLIKRRASKTTPQLEAEEEEVEVQGQEPQPHNAAARYKHKMNANFKQE